MNAKTVYSDSAAHAVAEKKAELGFTQISEILNVPGATFAAPCRPKCRSTRRSRRRRAPTAHPPTRRALHRVHQRSASGGVIKKKGMEVDPSRSAAANSQRRS